MMNQIYKIACIVFLTCNYNFPLYNQELLELPEQEHTNMLIEFSEENSQAAGLPGLPEQDQIGQLLALQEENKQETDLSELLEEDQTGPLLALPIEIYEIISQNVDLNLEPSSRLYCLNKETRERSLISYKKTLANFTRECFSKLDYNLSNKIYDYLHENLINNIDIKTRYDSYLFVKKILLQRVFDIAGIFNCNLENNKKIEDLLHLLKKGEPAGTIINVKGANISAFLLDSPKLYKQFLKTIVGKKSVFYTGLYKIDPLSNIRTICHSDYFYYNKNCFKYLNLILKNQIELENEPDLDMLLVTLVSMVVKVIEKSYRDSSNLNKDYNEILSDLYNNNPEIRRQLLKALDLLKNLNLQASPDVVLFARSNLACLSDKIVETIRSGLNTYNLTVYKM